MNLVNHQDGHPIYQPNLASKNVPTGKLQAVLGLFEYLANIGCPGAIISFALLRTACTYLVAESSLNSAFAVFAINRANVLFHQLDSCLRNHDSRLPTSRWTP